MEKQLRIIQIGTGSTVHSAHMAEGIRQLPEIYKHLGLVETDPVQQRAAEQREAFQGLPFFSMEEAFALKPDAFFVETDEPRLVRTAIQVLEAGFPVFMDKPGSGDSAEFHRMCRIADEKKLPFTIGYMFRGNPALREAMELVKNGRIGRIVSFEADMSYLGGKEYHEKLKRFPGGMMYYLGCHLIDQMVQFCGFPEKILPLNTTTLMHSGIECKDYGLCLFRYPEAIATIKTSASEFNGYARRCFFMTGTKGSIEIRPPETPVGDNFYTTELKLTLGGDHSTITFPKFRRYETILTDFADYVRGNKINPYTTVYESQLHDLILAAQGETCWQDYKK